MKIDSAVLTITEYWKLRLVILDLGVHEPLYQRCHRHLLVL